MYRDGWRDTVEKATISFMKMQGQGVLVPGGVILTAAHCLRWNVQRGMALGEHIIEEIETTQGKLRVTPLAVEPISDIAALGSLDEQAFSTDAENFQMFCYQTRPVQLAQRKFQFSEPFQVYTFTHEQKWVAGQAAKWMDDSAVLAVTFEEEIKGGTSGSAILDSGGRLVALVSHLAGPFGSIPGEGSAPHPRLALHAWVVRRIARNGRQERGFYVKTLSNKEKQ